MKSGSAKQAAEVRQMIAAMSRKTFFTANGWMLTVTIITVIYSIRYANGRCGRRQTTGLVRHSLAFAQVST